LIYKLQFLIIVTWRRAFITTIGNALFPS